MTPAIPILAIAALALACVAGCGGANLTPGKTAGERPLTLLASGDTAGWIVPCGCTANQSGGLSRRASYVTNLRTERDVVLVDVGGAISGKSPYDRAKFEAILRGEKLMESAAHNIGASEAKLGADYLRATAKSLGVALLSCNVRDRDGNLIGEPVKIVAAGGRRVALIGVLSPSFSLPELDVGPPRGAIADVLASLKQKQAAVDLVVVLAYLPTDELRQLAADLPEADFILGGPTGQSLAPQQIGPVWLAAATNKGKFLARFDAAATPRNASAATAWRGSIAEMTADLAADPAQQQNVQAFRRELARQDFPADQTSFAPSLPEHLPAGFSVAGTASCQKCHADDCRAWEASHHAAAWKTLIAKESQVDSFCQQCHTTGYGLPGGFASIARSPERTAVGCEDCHGPSQSHAADPREKTPYFAHAADHCTACHDHENSPNFAYSAYWQKIAHGKKIAATTTATEEP